MKRVLRESMLDWMQRADTSQALEQIVRLKDNKGWQAYISFLVYLKAMIRETVMSRKFWDLPDEERKISHKAFCYMDEFMDFCMNPMAVVESYFKIKKHNLAQERKLKTK